MQVIENDLIKEKVFIEKLDNGLTMMCIPRAKTLKKYIVLGTNYGSTSSKFIIPGESDVTVVPDGVAHFLEHKLFEQENGKNSLDVLSSLGVNANAFTSNTHTAYLYECTNNFYEALDEFMNYVQSPYFTDENVEKEKGIINQEIGMYDDDPSWKVYLNALKAMYQKNPVRIDPAGTVETVNKIDKEILYKCYDNFYKLSNMVIVVCGDFVPAEIFNEIKRRIIKNQDTLLPEKIIEKEPENINKPIIKEKMDINIPLFILGIKDNIVNNKGLNNSKEQVKKHIAIEIILDMVIGNSSKLYNELYDNGIIFSEISGIYEYERDYAYILIQSQSYEYEDVVDKIKNEFELLKNVGIQEEDFKRAKKKVYGNLVKDFEDISDMGNSFLESYFKGINLFDFIEETKNINIEYVNSILKSVIKRENMVLSVIEKK